MAIIQEYYKLKIVFIHDLGDAEDGAQEFAHTNYKLCYWAIPPALQDTHSTKFVP